jgi:hypothetical protein
VEGGASGGEGEPGAGDGASEELLPEREKKSLGGRVLGGVRGGDEDVEGLEVFRERHRRVGEAPVGVRIGGEEVAEFVLHGRVRRVKSPEARGNAQRDERDRERAQGRPTIQATRAAAREDGDARKRGAADGAGPDEDLPGHRRAIWSRLSTNDAKTACTPRAARVTPGMTKRIVRA